MGKIFTVVIILALVLGICGPSFGNDEIGRYQVIANPVQSILVDTVTGQTWHLDSVTLIRGEPSAVVWVPMPYWAGSDELSLFPPKSKKGTYPMKEQRD